MLYGICAAAVLALVLIPSILIAAEVVIFAGVVTPVVSADLMLGLLAMMLSAARLRR